MIGCTISAGVCDPHRLKIFSEHIKINNCFQNNLIIVVLSNKFSYVLMSHNFDKGSSAIEIHPMMA